MKKVFRTSSIVLFAILSLSGCQKPREDDSGPRADPTGNPNSNEVTTDCGVVMDGALRNPVNREDGEPVRIAKVMGGNLISVQDPSGGGAFLVKLHGLAPSDESRQDAAIASLTGISGGDLTFFSAGNGCDITLPDGGKGVIGQVISRGGESFSEKVMRSGSGNVDPADACGGDQIAACLSALKGGGGESAGEMRDFLWKPVSDTKGNIAVVLERHCNTDILVNGQKFQYAGSGNGRCGTFAGSKSGCSYGSNIRVEVIDKKSGLPYTHNGQPYVIVPNGCSRFEFQ